MYPRYLANPLTRLALSLALFSGTVAFAQPPANSPPIYDPPTIADSSVVVPSSSLVQRTYPVTDLVLPGNLGYRPGQPGTQIPTVEQLMELIRTIVAPESWSKLSTWDWYGVGFVIQDTRYDVVLCNLLQIITCDRITLDSECFWVGGIGQVVGSIEKPLPAGGPFPMDFGSLRPSTFAGSGNFYKRFTQWLSLDRICFPKEYTDLRCSGPQPLLREDEFNSGRGQFALMPPNTNGILAATLRYDPEGGYLVVRQTVQHHAEIGAFLTLLRQLRKLAVAAEREQETQNRRVCPADLRY